MAFNEEIVVRAYDSRVPIISAVGHQIDHPLSDEAAITLHQLRCCCEIAIPVKKN
jgi:exonuclease VII large subunit